MSDPYLGEIRAFPYSYVPKGWALCNGAVLEISKYPQLFALLGNDGGPQEGDSLGGKVGVEATHILDEKGDPAHTVDEFVRAASGRVLDLHEFDQRLPGAQANLAESPRRQSEFPSRRP